MGRATWIPEQLRAHGLTVVRTPGWEGRGWSTVDFRGLVCHHTASGPGRNAPSLGTVINGRPGLPGPLCQVLLARDGTCYVIAAGGANHAGRGGWDGLTGNSSVMGIEAENDGVGEPWPAAQIDAYHRCAAALNAGMAAAALRTCGHKEWTTRKIDPAGIDMTRFRTTIANLEEDAMSAKAEAQIDKIHQILTDDPNLPYGLASVLEAAQRPPLQVVHPASRPAERWVTDGIFRWQAGKGSGLAAKAIKHLGATPAESIPDDLFEALTDVASLTS